MKYVKKLTEISLKKIVYKNAYYNRQYITMELLMFDHSNLWSKELVEMELKTCLQYPTHYESLCNAIVKNDKKKYLKC